MSSKNTVSRLSIVEESLVYIQGKIDNLKESIQRAFDLIRLDMEKAKNALQSFNERIGKLESAQLEIAGRAQQDFERTKGYEARIAALEANSETRINTADMEADLTDLLGAYGYALSDISITKSIGVDGETQYIKIEAGGSRDTR